MGHLPDKEYRRLRHQYLSGEITPEEFLKQYHDPANYTPADPDRNHSHQDEGER